MSFPSAAGTAVYAVAPLAFVVTLFYYALPQLATRAFNGTARNLTAAAGPDIQQEYDVVIVGGGESPSLISH